MLDNRDFGPCIHGHPSEFIGRVSEGVTIGYRTAEEQKVLKYYILGS